MEKLAQVRDPIPGNETIDGVATIQGFEWIFNNVLSVALGLSGVVLFVMLLVGGFKRLTSGGNPKNIESAKNTLTYAILGLVLVASAYLIIRFIEEITGAQLSVFRVVIP